MDKIPHCPDCREPLWFDAGIYFCPRCRGGIWKSIKRFLDGRCISCGHIKWSTKTGALLCPCCDLGQVPEGGRALQEPEA